MTPVVPIRPSAETPDPYRRLLYPHTVVRWGRFPTGRTVRPAALGSRCTIGSAVLWGGLPTRGPAAGRSRRAQLALPSSLPPRPSVWRTAVLLACSAGLLDSLPRRRRRANSLRRTRYWVKIWPPLFLLSIPCRPKLCWPLSRPPGRAASSMRQNSPALPDGIPSLSNPLRRLLRMALAPLSTAVRSSRPCAGRWPWPTPALKSPT